MCAASGSSPVSGGEAAALLCSGPLLLLVLGCSKKEASNVAAVCCAFSARECTAALVKCSSAWMARGCTSPTPCTAHGTSSSTRPWSSKKRLGGRGPLWHGLCVRNGKGASSGGYTDASVIAGGESFLTSSPQPPHVEFHMQLTHRLLWLGRVQLLPVWSCSARALLGRA